MVKKIKRVIERERIKHPGKPGISLLVNRLVQKTNIKLDQLVMSFKKDSTFRAPDDLFMCSLFPQGVLELVIDELNPKSVLDVGCGVGNSLKYYLANNIDAWGVENSSLAISRSSVKERIIRHNLKRPLNLLKKFDLVWSFEVIEHIHPDFENVFLATLSSHSDRILISAARPGQGGHGHFNEQLPEYWIEKFAKLGFSLDENFSSRARAIKETHAGNLLLFTRSGS